MKQLIKFFGIATVLLVLAVNSLAQVTLYSTATATIVETITLTKLEDLDFGNLAVTTTAGTCILDPEAGTPTRTPTGGVTLPGFTGTPTAASFQVTGVPNQYYTIIFPETFILITRISGTETMTVDTWTTDQTLNVGQLDPLNGESIFYVGATVHVDISQTPGVYTNSPGFPVTVNYQ